MKRLLLIGIAACALAATPILSASAMTIPKTITPTTTDRDIVQVKGGHGHGHGHMGHHGGRGHHYGWTRGRHRGHH